MRCGADRVLAETVVQAATSVATTGKQAGAHTTGPLARGCAVDRVWSTARAGLQPEFGFPPLVSPPAQGLASGAGYVAMWLAGAWDTVPVGVSSTVAVIAARAGEEIRRPDPNATRWAYSRSVGGQPNPAHPASSPPVGRSSGKNPTTRGKPASRRRPTPSGSQTRAQAQCSVL
jgi:hypothetical protein